jgi:hypothetical protein
VRLALRERIDSGPCIGCVARLLSGYVVKTPIYLLVQAIYGYDIVEANVFVLPTQTRTTPPSLPKRSICLLHVTGIPPKPEKLSAYPLPK